MRRRQLGGICGPVCLFVKHCVVQPVEGSQEQPLISTYRSLCLFSLLLLKLSAYSRGWGGQLIKQPSFSLHPQDSDGDKSEDNLVVDVSNEVSSQQSEISSGSEGGRERERGQRGGRGGRSGWDLLSLSSSRDS